MALVFVVVILFFIFFYNTSVFSGFENFQDQLIPKIVYQTYPTKDLPKELKKIYNWNRYLNTDYQFKIYDDGDIIKYIHTNYGKELLTIYLNISDDYGAAKADLFRYLILYQKGGIYLDIKSKCNFRFAKFIKPNDHFIIDYWLRKDFSKKRCKSKEGEIPQWYIISEPQHPYLRHTIYNVIKRLKNYDIKKNGFGKRMVLNITGPYVWTQSIEEIQNLAPFRRTKIYPNYLNYTGLKGIKSHNNHKQFFKKHYSYSTSPLLIKKLPDYIYDKVLKKFEN